MNRRFSDSGVASFLEQGPRWLAEICKALTTGDVQSLALAAHDLAAAASVLGVGVLGHQCIEIEAFAQRGEIDTIGERLPSLMAAWERAEMELRALYQASPVARTLPRVPFLPG
jgi:HPt (histidine-containing phosphotransfer) domain-containing protein